MRREDILILVRQESISLMFLPILGMFSIYQQLITTQEAKHFKLQDDGSSHTLVPEKWT